MHLKPLDKKVSCVTIKNKAHNYGLFNKRDIKMIDYKFSAKRIDNGELIEGRISYNSVKDDVVQWIDADGYLRIHRIDPSTITPLFTADKPGVWLFENVDLDQFSIITYPEDVKNIHSGWLNNTLEYYSGNEWSLNGDTALYKSGIYRVKVPGYSIDDAMNDIGFVETIDQCVDILAKFAKANGIGGNNE